MYIIVGLGNPGEEYEETRHNAGRMAVSAFIKKVGLPEAVPSAKYFSLISEGKVGSEKVLVLMPETFMNKSGAAIKNLITSVKKAETLVVIHDDLDMPLGKIKILFNRGTGGHNGLESIKKVIKTDAYIRVKVGISPSTPGGKLKKPDSSKVLDFIISKFKKPELELMKKVSKKAAEAIETIVVEGKEKAQEIFNQ
ncbi:MAG: aminoacyl-tRNA hydrolase [Patescibacteria group bacterium]